MKTSSNILSTQSIPKLFMKYAIPAVIAMVISGVQGMIDGMFVGNYVSTNALASVNIALPFMQLIVGISMIISIGTQSYVGLNLGKGNKEKAQNCFNTFKIIIWISAALITLLGLTLNMQIANLLGADATLISDTSTYIKVISVFAIPMCTMFYFGFLNRIVGKPERYFYGSVISIIVNVSLDYLFIARLDLGVMGAALATGLAYTSALLFVVSPMLKKENVINVFVGKFSTESIGETLYNGSSEGINSISAAVIAFLFNTSLMKISGAGGVAAFTAINYVGTFGTMLLFGISDGIGPIVSYNFGTNDTKRVKQLMKIAYVSNLIFGIILFSLLFFAGEQLVGLFIKDEPELVQLAVSGGKLYAISFLMSGFNILNSGYFTFIGKGLESVIVAASRGFVFVSIGIVLLPKIFDINGIWLSVPFAELCAVIVGLILLRKMNIKSEQSNIVKDYNASMSETDDKRTTLDSQATFNHVITINRQFGSGGREVAKKLADTLGCAYYDKELISAIVKKLEVSSDLIDTFDVNNFRYTFSRSFMTYNRLPIGEVKLSQAQMLSDLANKTKGVFVGQCSNHVLHEYKPLKVFIYASNTDFKIERCFDKVPEDLQIKSRDEIKKEIAIIDSKRSEYYKVNTGENWNDINNYNLCIDTSKVGIEGAVEIIVNALKYN